MLILILLFSVVINNCSMYTINQYYPDPADAENPPGLYIDTKNFAYLGGQIRAIKDYDFNPGQGAIHNYPKRSVRVPAGEEMTALVYYSYTISNGTMSTIYYGFRHISVPPLENGIAYILYIDNSTAHNKWDDKNINFLRIDPVSWRIKKLSGAKFIQQSIQIPWLNF